MFALKSPCADCPFRKGVGHRIGLPPERLTEIFTAPAFQCHKTVDYEAWEEGGDKAGENPQQCAGLMAVLSREGRPNQIMQVAQRLGALDPAALDPRREAYGSIGATRRAHGRYSCPSALVGPEIGN